MKLSGITKKQLNDWFGVYVRKNKAGEDIMVIVMLACGFFVSISAFAIYEGR